MCESCAMHDLLYPRATHLGSCHEAKGLMWELSGFELLKLSVCRQKLAATFADEFCQVILEFRVAAILGSTERFESVRLERCDHGTSSNLWPIDSLGPRCRAALEYSCSSDNRISRFLSAAVY